MLKTKESDNTTIVDNNLEGMNTVNDQEIIKQAIKETKQQKENIEGSLTQTPARVNLASVNKSTNEIPNITKPLNENKLDLTKETTLKNDAAFASGGELRKRLKELEIKSKY